MQLGFALETRSRRSSCLLITVGALWEDGESQGQLKLAFFLSLKISLFGQGHGSYCSRAGLGLLSS